MRLYDATNLEDYLRATGRVAVDQPVRIRELTGGVSNMVLLVEPISAAGIDGRVQSEPFVVKQARAQLRTRHEWHSSVERIWREADVLRICSRLLASPLAAQAPLAGARTPNILFEDRDEYLFAMTAAPLPHTVWKAELLAGRADPAIAAACGALLGTLHAASWRDATLAQSIGNRTLFNELRVDPYYRTLALERPETAPAVARLIDSLDAYPLSLVHADFSPKNLLVFAGGTLLVDFETGHFGDPAFDLGFFLSHLLLKACLKAPRQNEYLQLAACFCDNYDNVVRLRMTPTESAALWSRGVQHLAGCASARLDGKSPVEYLSDAARRECVRSLCRHWFDVQPATWREALSDARGQFGVLPPASV